MNLGLCITLYNPIDKYIENILSISDIFEKVYVYDNSNYSNSQNLAALFSSRNNILYYSNSINDGLCVAFNVACRQSVKDSIDWLLFLDQDSTFDKDSILLLKKYASQVDQDMVGMVGPRIVYQWENLNNLKVKTATEHPKWIITSGSMLNMNAYKSVGDFDENYFINYIEPDYCFRLRQKGYDIIVFNDVLLFQVLGYDEKSGKKVGTHSPLRLYYTHRNKKYFAKKFKKELGFFGRLLFLLKRSSSYIRGVLFKENKKERLQFIKKANLDFKKGSFGRYEANS